MPIGWIIGTEGYVNTEGYVKRLYDKKKSDRTLSQIAPDIHPASLLHNALVEHSSDLFVSLISIFVSHEVSQAHHFVGSKLDKYSS